jgi:hypothetical protein
MFGLSLNFILLMLALTVSHMILGMVWYGPLLFGKFWMRLMGADKLSTEEIKAMQKTMLPYYILQFILSLITSYLLTAFVWSLQVDPFIGAALLWLGFVMPTQISSVIWGGTEKSQWLKQSLVMTGYTLVGFMISAGIIYAWFMF